MQDSIFLPNVPTNVTWNGFRFRIMAYRPLSGSECQQVVQYFVSTKGGSSKLSRDCIYTIVYNKE